MNTKLGRTTILVENYDEAYSFYNENFFCRKLFDHTTPQGQRYLHVAFSADEDHGIWFLQAENRKIGQQTAGQPTLVIYTDTIEQLYQHVHNNGVTIIDELVSTSDSKYFHCLDLYGNRITIVQLN